METNYNNELNTILLNDNDDFLTYCKSIEEEETEFNYMLMQLETEYCNAYGEY